MIVVRYEIGVHEGTMDFIHGMSVAQVRFFFPSFNVTIGYRKKESLDFFEEGNEDIELVNGVYVGKFIERDDPDDDPDNGKVTNVVVIELPDEIVVYYLKTGREMNEKKKEMQELTERFVELTEEQLALSDGNY